MLGFDSSFEISDGFFSDASTDPVSSGGLLWQAIRPSKAAIARGRVQIVRVSFFMIAPFRKFFHPSGEIFSFSTLGVPSR
jgi:hypothetical protein